VTPDQQWGRRHPEGTGYHWQLLAALMGLLAFAFGLVVALVFCTLCIAGSVVLWFRGLYGVIEWGIQVGKCFSSTEVNGVFHLPILCGRALYAR